MFNICIKIPAVWQGFGLGLMLLLTACVAGMATPASLQVPRRWLALAWSVDQAKLFLVSADLNDLGQVYTFELATRTLQKAPGFSTVQAHAIWVEPQPAGQHVAFSSSQGTTQIMDATGQPLGPTLAGTSFAWRADSASLVVGDTEHDPQQRLPAQASLVVYDLARHQQTVIWENTNPDLGIFRGLTWLPTQDIVFSLEIKEQADLYQLEMATNTLHPLTNMPQSHEVAPAVSPDGQWLAYIQTDLNLKQAQLIVTTLDLQQSTVLETFAGSLASPKWSNDSQHIAYLKNGEVVMLDWSPTKSD